MTLRAIDMAKRYLVTGCAGFIASRVTEMLLDAGHVVDGIDDLNDAYDPRLKHWRLARLKSRQRFQFYQLDIAQIDSLASLFQSKAGPADDQSVEEKPYSAVVNLAARAGVRQSLDNPWAYYKTNCTGTLNLLEMCRIYGVKKFLLASTSSLYGGQNRVPFNETDDTNKPLSPYAASKKAAETLAYTYHHLYGLDVSIPRYFTVYGPAGRPDMSVFRFIRWIAEGQPIVLFGDGSQSRDFTFVDDIAWGTIAALKPLGYEIINLGGDRPSSISAVIEQISALLGRKPTIDSRPLHRADVPATWADINTAKRLLDWQPRIPLEEGLRKSVDWYRQNREMAIALDLGAI
jgi:UDP-glucuronate 4-epimerase